MTSFSLSSLTALSRRRMLVPAALAGVLIWAFAPTFAELAHRWSTDTQYSHGYLVPVFAVFLLWRRRESLFPKKKEEDPGEPQTVENLARLEPRPLDPTPSEVDSKSAAARQPCSPWWGLALLALGTWLRFVGDYLYMDWIDAAALLPCLAGLVLLVGGKAALSWTWPSIGFLAFMIPLPFSLETALAHPLQHLATLVSTYALQTIGLPALSEGNTILINETRIGVVEACSGLSMLVIFFALSTAFIIWVKRPWWQSLLLLASAVPIALIANITRITVTGLMHETVGHMAADLVFHDLAGYLMPPFALGLLWLELKGLSRLLVDVPTVERVSMSRLRSAMPAPVVPPSKRRRSKKTSFPPAPQGPRRV